MYRQIHDTAQHTHTCAQRVSERNSKKTEVKYSKNEVGSRAQECVMVT